MSFSIERYKEESKKVDVTGIAWDDVGKHTLSKGDLFCLHYMMERRWPEGIFCPTCGRTDVTFIAARCVWQCRSSLSRPT